MEEKYKVAILDDEPVWLDAIEALLSRSDEVEIAGAALSQDEAVEIARSLTPDMFLVDMNLAHEWQNGVSATVAILDASPKTEVVILTAAESDQNVVDAISAGAISFMQKSNCEQLLSSVLKNMRGEFLPSVVIAKSFARLRRENITSSLSEQELQVLDHLSQNASRSQIQEALKKSEGTIKSQIRSILKKLGVSKTSEAVSKIKHGGILIPEEPENSRKPGKNPRG